MAALDDCAFGPGPHPRRSRHSHRYVPDGPGARQCTCGSRQWEICLYPSLPPEVACQRCHRPNYTATAYEKGREAGPRRRPDAPESPPF